jgi:peroxiredoxin
MGSINVNDKAPSFNLPDAQKKMVSLEDYAGRKLVIAFFPAVFTGVCTTEMCTLSEGLSSFEGLGASVVGISVDSLFANGAFAKAEGIAFPLLSDHTRATVEAYDVVFENFATEGYTAATRSVFIVDEAGMISYKWLAPNPGVEPNYDEIKAALA